MQLITTALVSNRHWSAQISSLSVRFLIQAARRREPATVSAWAKTRKLRVSSWKTSYCARRTLVFTLRSLYYAAVINTPHLLFWWFCCSSSGGWGARAPVRWKTSTWKDQSCSEVAETRAAVILALSSYLLIKCVCCHEWSDLCLLQPGCERLGLTFYICWFYEQEQILIKHPTEWPQESLKHSSFQLDVNNISDILPTIVSSFREMTA